MGGKVKMRHDKAALHGAGKERCGNGCHITVDMTTNCSLRTNIPLG